VFASPVKEKAHLSDPNGGMADACAAANLEGLTLHGLRRSFKSLTEWLEIPAGVVAQIMGHKPFASRYSVPRLQCLMFVLILPPYFRTRTIRNVASARSEQGAGGQRDAA